MKRRTASLLALLLGAAWLWIAAPNAAAGTYVVHACRVDGAPAPLDGWTTQSVGGFDAASGRPRRIFNDCGSLRGFGIDYGDGTGALVQDGWTVTAPPDTRLIELRLADAHISPYSAGLALPWHGDNPTTAIRLVPSDTDFGLLDASSFSLWMSCLACAASPESPMSFRIPEAELTLRDDSPPTLSAPVDGTALQGGAISGVATVVVPYRDQGSGLSSVDLLVDGAVTDRLKLGGDNCTQPFVHMVPCPIEGTADLPLDTATLADGPHRVLALLKDASGNATPAGPYTILVGHASVTGGPGSQAVDAQATSVAGAPIVDGFALGGTLKAGFGHRLARRLTVGYSAPPTIRGIVTGAEGKPLAGAVVQWSERDARPSAAFTARPPVRTDQKGRFLVRLPAGVSRTIRVAYGASIATLKLRVRAPVALGVDRDATRNGRRIHFRGTVRGAGTARTYVELQAWAGSWITFRTVSLSSGQFQATYRFTRTFATTRYSFRAVVHPGPTLPYVGGTSLAVKVLVRP